MGLASNGDAIRAQYAHYYGSERLARWRRLGALDKARNIVRLCEDYPHERIIEIGCGEGAVLERLNELGFGRSYVGLEISPSGIEVARAKEIRGVSEFICFDGYNIPYEDSRFDLAIVTHVLEHVEHPRQLLYEAGRVAEYIFVEVPLEATVRLGKDYVPDSTGHINFYTDKTIRRLLQTCDFEVLAQIIADDSKEILTFQYGSAGLLRYALRRLGLRVLPDLAKYVFVYNAALIARAPIRR